MSSKRFVTQLCRGFSSATRTRPFQVAIDGPAASGKSTTAKMVAQRLGFSYIDTGAFYRCVTFAALSEGIDPSHLSNADKITALAEKLDIELQTVFSEKPDSYNRTTSDWNSASDASRQHQLPTTRVFLDSKDVSSDIRTGTVSKHVSAVAAIGPVREAVLQKVRNIGATDVEAQTNNGINSSARSRAAGLVMDGRDIGTVVLPLADLKVFLVADSHVRAKRRLQELVKNGADPSIDDTHLNLHAVQADLELRDEMDRTRKISPLRRAVDAMDLDTSNLTLEQQVDIIVQEVHRRRSHQKT
ncbi:hypothetical protein BG011_008303 [Mortierella polycephala]|uniref:(d)CMP kinase n=1 Tax=Mortierella polycephala TaxID=41804 RepID=A0A9P6U878_9FUNG|nr:hypothetical protein BG011_008303 [Mortierella polycephala]